MSEAEKKWRVALAWIAVIVAGALIGEYYQGPILRLLNNLRLLD